MKLTLEVISKTLDFYMKPVAAKHFSFLKDSQNLIQLTQNLTFTENSKLLTADFDSLYSNIPIDKSIEIISDMMKKVILTILLLMAFIRYLNLHLKTIFSLSETIELLTFIFK